ncbi:hypothetical protein [Sediminimonas qiaohouensis]|uniref:hypothetical protein n=1 Tax=Sediminimonas qiaohouensis TaxID=552061 RepID=UPI00040E3D4C|nr:hypothetical protein [Sediminimonas qiaohouensis]
MSLIRPEARSTLWKLREVLAGAVIGGLGLYWGLTALAPLSWVGWGVLFIGCILSVSGLQRARFWRGKGGPGVVRVDEGQVAYFGPYDGGAVALSELSRLELDPAPDPPLWYLYQPGQPVLAIPVTAENADTLFDSFAALPGMRTERMLSALRGGGEHRIVIWAKEMRRLH